MVAYIDFDAVGKRIRSYRKQAHMTQEALAERIHVSSNFVGNIERGVGTPSATTLFRICLALDITMKDLLDETTVLWRDEDTPSRLREPGMTYCNTLSDWLLQTEPAEILDDSAPAYIEDLSSIGFLMLDEDFPEQDA